VRAVVHDRYGPPEVLRVEEVEGPVPADDEILVRVHATTVTQTDSHKRRAKPFVWRFMLGLLRPKRRILGLELAGEVEAVEDVLAPERLFAAGEYRPVIDRTYGSRTSWRRTATSRRARRPGTSCCR
jgi:threonine dehydrogenase-like Zn-dependent dehydrogenase